MVGVQRLDSFELRRCLDCADGVFKEKFGEAPDFKNLEAIFKNAQTSDKRLSYKLVNKMTRAKYWNFNDFWIIPTRWNYKKYSDKTIGLFQGLPEKEEHAIEQLYVIFKNIEVVSILLRFIDPKNYGIISPPVRYALGLKAKDNYVAEYLDYLSTLRAYAMEYHFDRAADADVALWTLVEKCLRSENTKCENLRKFREKLVDIEEEYIRKNQLFKNMETDILELAGKEEEEKQAELDRVKKELKDLRAKTDTIPKI